MRYPCRVKHAHLIPLGGHFSLLQTWKAEHFPEARKLANEAFAALQIAAEFCAAAVALNMMHYNFVRIHQTLPVTPAIAARVTNHVWEVSDLVALLEA